MMGNFFNRMYNGKNRSDFTPDELPDNRFALFFDMLKIRFMKLIQVNLLFLIFLLPMLFFVIAYIMYIFQYPDEALPMLSQTLLLNIPCMGIAGIGLVGMTYITRNWARDQHAYVWSDFIDSIKENWKQGLVLGLIDGILVFVMSMAGLYYAINSGDNILYYLLGWVMVVMLAVLAMANIYLWPMVVTYNVKLLQHLRNALVIAIGRLPFSLLFLIITLLPLALAFIFMDVMLLPVMLFYILIGLSLASFINVSYTNSVFDRYINVNIEGAQVNQGLRERDDEDDDDEDE